MGELLRCSCFFLYQVLAKVADPQACLALPTPLPRVSQDYPSGIWSRSIVTKKQHLSCFVFSSPWPCHAEVSA